MDAQQAQQLLKSSVETQCVPKSTRETHNKSNAPTVDSVQRDQNVPSDAQLAAYSTPARAAKHTALADFLLDNPRASNAELAAHMGWTEPWCSTIKNSDLFKSYYQERLQARTAQIDTEVAHGVRNLAKASVDALTAKVERKRDLMDTEDLISIANTSLKAMGLGDKVAPGAAGVVINVGTASREALEAARADMHRLTETNTKDAEQPAQEVLPPAS